MLGQPQLSAGAMLGTPLRLLWISAILQSRDYCSDAGVKFYVGLPMLGKQRPEFVTAGVYALSSASLACAFFYYTPYGENNLFGLAASLLPLFFLIPYVIFLARAATARQRIMAAAGNGICVISLAKYIYSQPFWPPPVIPPFVFIAGGMVVMLSAFALAAIALFSGHRNAYALGTVATILIWPCLLAEFSASRDFGEYGVAKLAGIIAILTFGVATALILVRPALGYWTGLVASSLAWPYLAFRELSYIYNGNSWVVFNIPFSSYESAVWHMAELQILACVLATLSTLISLMRLCPSSWAIRRVPVQSRTWPVFVLTLIFVAAWFGRSVTPYRVPGEHGGIFPEIGVVHFEKKGLRSSETRVAVMRDGRFYRCSNVREPLRYKSDGECVSGDASFQKWQPVAELVRSTSFRASGTPVKDVPHRWNSDTWYVYGYNFRSVAFSTANKTMPPKEIVDWFNQMETMRGGNSYRYSSRDICLGLCYEPQI